MSCLSGYLNKDCIVYDIDFSQTTESGQPIETLTQVKTIKCLFTDNVKRLYQLFDPGQIKVGLFILFTIKVVTENQVVEIDNVKYRVTRTRPINPLRNRHIMGYQSYVEHYKH
jgi:hypothetical protein